MFCEIFHNTKLVWKTTENVLLFVKIKVVFYPIKYYLISNYLVLGQILCQTLEISDKKSLEYFWRIFMSVIGRESIWI